MLLKKYSGLIRQKMENTVYLYQAAVNKGDISVNID
jgi:hypothetical protein